jgi:hypothetical protein
VRRRQTVAWDALRKPGAIFEWNGAHWTDRVLATPIPTTDGLRAG